MYVNLNIQCVPKGKLKILRDDSFYYNMKNKKNIVINVGLRTISWEVRKKLELQQVK